MLEIMDLETTMRYLNVKSATTFSKLMKEGLPYVRLGKEKRYPRQSVDEFIIKSQVREQINY